MRGILPITRQFDVSTVVRKRDSETPAVSDGESSQVACVSCVIFARVLPPQLLRLSSCHVCASSRSWSLRSVSRPVDRSSRGYPEETFPISSSSSPRLFCPMSTLVFKSEDVTGLHQGTVVPPVVPPVFVEPIPKVGRGERSGNNGRVEC